MTGRDSPPGSPTGESDGPFVAVVGMAAHLPGAPDLDRFWARLRAGAESIRHFTEEELEKAGVDPALLRNPRYVRSRGVLDGMRAFDAGFFGLSPRDAAVMDPQTRHFLECTWHALEHAGHVPESFPGTIGVFAGAGASQYFWKNVVRNRELMDSVGYFLLRHTGNDKDFVATRASYEFGLTGPSVGVQTACSTSLVAIHYACQSLLSWECDLALAGGVTIEQPHEVGYLYEEGGILSPDGHCRSYDRAAAGTVFGSGSGVVALRRLSDAVAAGDTIHAVVRGSAVNNDGAAKVSYLAPSVDGQARAVSEALALADVDPASIGLVEGHGTGTPVGDPIEVAALTQAFRAGTDRTGFCALGSVKSNIGHLDTAAGVAGFIKAVLAVKHGEIPPTVHFQAPAPLLGLEGSPFYVNSELVPWPAGETPRRAAVNSLGVGGTNAHVIVEEPPPAAPPGPARSRQLLTLSARTPRALEDASRQLMEALEGDPELPLAHVSHTLRCGRRRFDHRRALVCTSTRDAVEQLALGDGPGWVTAQEEAEGREVAFLFAGGGAQYPGMGRELYDTEPVYRDVMDRCIRHLRDRENLDITPVLFPPAGGEAPAARELRRPSTALPALFAVQSAQARLWMSWGVRPTALLGHSMGEYTAACLAGVFTLEDALSLVSLRGRLFERLEPGAMVSVGLDEERLRSLLGTDLSIAAVNAPEVVVASGPVSAVEVLEARLAAEGIDHRRIAIEVAAHSAMVEPILTRFRDRVSSIPMDPPALPLLSNLTGDRAGADVTDPAYWVRHLRETVRFADGLGRILAEGDAALLEVGPGRTLTTLARLHPSFAIHRPAVHSLPHPGDARDAVSVQLAALGELWVHGVTPRWAEFDRGRGHRRIPLPGYPFQREDYFVAPPEDAEGQEGRRGVSPSATAGGSRDPRDWLQQRSWRPVPRPGAGADAQPCHVLLLAQDGAAAKGLETRLEHEGHRVTRVRAGADFSGGAGGYEVRPGSWEDWRALVASLARENGLPDRVVHAWCLDSGRAATMDHAFFAPLHLMRAVESEHPGHQVRFLALADSVVPGSTGVVAEHAALLGPFRVGPREIPTLSCRLIATDGLPADPARRERVLDRLVAEMESPAKETLVSYRGGERWVEDFVPLAGQPAKPDVAWEGGGACLITGGLGGLGLVAARVLVGRGIRHLVLLGRSGLPPRESWARWPSEHPGATRTLRAMAQVETLEAMGASVRIVRADVTDEAAVLQAVREAEEAFGGLRGVVHAAGVLDDGPLLDRDRMRSWRVLAPKVLGVRALDRALHGRTLDFFWLFSSVSAVVGPPGQADYAAANAVLDAYAHERAERTGESVLSLAWGPWSGVGMAAERVGEIRHDREIVSGGRSRLLEHPLFDRVDESPDGARVYATDFRVERHWMLEEHRLRHGGWILPGAGYVELIRAAAQLEAPEPPFVLRDLTLLEPFRVGSDEVGTLEVRLAPGVDGGFHVSVQGRRPGRPWVEHATARIPRVSRTSSVLETRLSEVRARLGPPVPGPRPAHPVMAFGPRWENVTGSVSGDGEALLEHQLPVRFQPDLQSTPLHPALLDMATAGATHLVPGLDPATDFLLPVGYGHLRLHGPLADRLSSHVRLRSADETAGLASFDVVVYGPDGEVVLEVDDFTMIRMDGADLLRDAHEAPAWLEDAIDPAEGARVMELLLSRTTPAHVLISRRQIGDLVREADREAGTRARRAPGGAATPRVFLPEVREALLEHEAVREAAALGSRAESEPARVVAFVEYQPGAHTTVSELRRFLRRRLERRWVPQNFVELVALPRDEAGNVRREELRDPFASTEDHVEPRTPTERAIAGIWSELLGLERVGIRDNFLDAGGHSLVGIRVLLRIRRETGVRIEAHELAMQTLEQLAAQVDRRRSGGEAPGQEADGSPRGAATSPTRSRTLPDR